MEKDLTHTSNSEYTGFNEVKLDKKIDQIRNQNIQGTILFSSKPLKKKKPFNWIRIRSFFIRHKGFKRSMEFSCHPSGIHLLRMAMLYSESGCKMCKVYIERNLF